MFKKAIVVCTTAIVVLLCTACSKDAEDACEHMNELCGTQEGFTKADCSKSKDDYDKLSDADKEKSDKMVECIMDANTCEAAVGCALK